MKEGLLILIALRLRIWANPLNMNKYARNTPLNTLIFCRNLIWFSD